jgi:hypothetical protein
MNEHPVRQGDSNCDATEGPKESANAGYISATRRETFMASAVAAAQAAYNGLMSRPQRGGFTSIVG